MPIGEKENLDAELEASDVDVTDRSESEIEGQEAKTDDEDSERDAADTGDDADPAKAVVGLKKRLAKVTAQRNDARRKAEERDALEARVRAYEQRAREEDEAQRQRAEATPERRKATEQRAAIRAAIDDVYGDGTSDYLDSRPVREQLDRDAYANQAVSHLTSELEDHGLATDERTLVRWERAVGGELDGDPKLLTMYQTPSMQRKAIQIAMERVRDGLVNPVAKQTGGQGISRAQRNREAVLGGGRNAGAVAQAAEPELELKPPKELQGRALTEWWENQREGVWKRIVAQEA